MKKSLPFIASGIIFLLAALYINIVFIIPALINSDKFVNFAENSIHKNFGTDVKIQKINLNISPTFKTKFSVDVLKIITIDNKAVVELQDFKVDYDIKKINKGKISAKFISVNIDELLKIFPSKKKTVPNKKKNFNFNIIPDINVEEIVVQKNKNPQLSADIKNFRFLSSNDKKIIDFSANIKLDRLLEPIILGNNGSVYIKNNDIYVDDYLISLGNKAFFRLNGTIFKNGKVGDLNLSAKNIPVSDTMRILLYLQKFTDPTKKFIENFKNYNGLGNVDLCYKNNELSGYAKLTNVSAKTVLFSIPLNVQKAEFFIKNNEVNSFVEGFAGHEKITHKLHMVNIMSKDRIAYGEVKTKITKPLVDKYFPDKIDLKNHIDLSIDYKIQNRKVTVKYRGYLPKSTDVVVAHYSAGIPDKERLITAETYKDGVQLFLKNYKYALSENGNYKNIVTGDGYFINENGKMFPQYITCKTDGFVPNSFVGSFGNYVSGGAFSGSLKYVVPKKQILGNFEVKDTIFNHFHVKSAQVTGDDKVLKVLATGKYKGQDFSCKGDTKNDFRDTIYVNNMDLFLDRFIVKKDESVQKETKKIDIDASTRKVSSSVKKINMDIKEWQISGNTLIINDVEFNDILLKGSLNDGVFKYEIPKLNYANGVIRASGTYDFDVDLSVIDFSAKNIDSNIVATEFFDFPNQVLGSANATLHSQTRKNLDDWHMYATFEIDNGALPQLENFEFAPDKLNPARKVRISDYIKVNATKKGNLKSKLKGSFKADDYKIYDVDIRFQHEFLSSYITGVYNYIKGDEHAYIFGKYDKSVSKRIKILAIPLNWIINLFVLSEHSKDKYSAELNKIPPIGIDNSKANFFKINVEGNPNAKKVNIEVRLLKD